MPHPQNPSSLSPWTVLGASLAGGIVGALGLGWIRARRPLSAAETRRAVERLSWLLTQTDGTTTDVLGDLAAVFADDDGRALALPIGPHTVGPLQRLAPRHGGWVAPGPVLRIRSRRDLAALLAEPSLVTDPAGRALLRDVITRRPQPAGPLAPITVAALSTAVALAVVAFAQILTARRTR